MILSPNQRAVLLFVITTASVPILEALVKLDLDQVLRDPSTWAIGVLAASVRAAAGALLGRLVESRVMPRG